MTINTQILIDTIFSVITFFALAAVFVYQKLRMKDYDRFINIFDLDKLEQYAKMNEKLFENEKKIIETNFESILKEKELKIKDYDKLYALAEVLLKAYREQNQYIKTLEQNPYLQSPRFRSYIKQSNSESKKT